MIRRSGITILNTVSKKLLNTHRDSAILRTPYEAVAPPSFFNPGNEQKSFHSLTNSRVHTQELRFHDQNTCLCCLKPRNLSTDSDSKAEGEVDEAQAGSEEGGVKKEVRDPEKDRTKEISLETSMRYIQSDGNQKILWIS